MARFPAQFTIYQSYRQIDLNCRYAKNTITIENGKQGVGFLKLALAQSSPGVIFFLLKSHHQMFR